MKKRLLHSLIATSIIMSVSAQAGYGERPGFSFGISMNAGINDTQSQLNTHEDNEVTADLDNSGKSVSEPFIFPGGGHLAYTTQDMTHTFYLGNSESDVIQGSFGAELGYMYRLPGDTKLKAAMLIGLDGEVWSDPFLTNAKRSTTDNDVGGFKVALEDILTLPLTLEYATAKVDIDNEDSGKALGLSASDHDLVDRDGTYHEFSGQVAIPLSAQFVLIPSVSYLVGDTNGTALAFDEIETGITAQAQLQRHTLAATGIFASREYDSSHPVFNTKRDDDSREFLLYYSYAEPFNWPGTAVNALVRYSERDSNITFYDTETTTFAMGMAYNF